MEFKLTPHIKKILCGRGMCKDGRLLCSATHCLHHPEDSPDPDFGREIEVKGYAVCPRCGYKVLYPDHLVWDDRKVHSRLVCPICKKIIPISRVKWTTIVVSRHKRRRHYYYHKECWDAMFIDLK